MFVFPGQGAQYPGMGAQLYQHHRVFAATLDECDQALRPWTGWSVREVLCQDPAAPPLERVDVVQPVLFAVMVSLAEVLGSYGIVPDAVIGHSQGEIAAAYIAGVLSLADAAKIVALRSAALARLSGAGAMASVLLAADELHPRLQRWGDALSIAAINGPRTPSSAVRRPRWSSSSRPVSVTASTFGPSRWITPRILLRSNHCVSSCWASWPG